MNALIPLARVSMTDAQRSAVESYGRLLDKLGRVPTQEEAVSRLVIDLGGRRHGASMVLNALRKRGIVRADGTLAEAIMSEEPVSPLCEQAVRETQAPGMGDSLSPGADHSCSAHPMAGKPVVDGDPIARALHALLLRGGRDGRGGYVLGRRPCSAGDLVRAANLELARLNQPLIAYPGVAVPCAGVIHGTGPARR